MNLIIVGAGSYVSGKNTSGFGTILPAVIEGVRNGLIDKTIIVSKHNSSISEIEKKIHALQKITNVKLDYEHYPKGKSDSKAYERIIKKEKNDTLVIVAVPDNLHYEIARTAIDSGKHVLVVKPLTPTIKEARNLTELAKKKNVHAVVDFHKRYDHANLKIQEIIIKKKIGDIEYAHVEYSQRKIMPEVIFRSWVGTTNIFQYLAVHYVDIIHFVTNAKPLRVLAMGKKNYLQSKNIDTYDSIQAIIEWQNGKTKFVSTILCNWIDPNSDSAVSYQQIKFIGSRGRIESDQKNRGFQVVTDQNGVEDINPYFNQSYLDNSHTYFSGYGIQSILQFFRDCNSIYEGKSIPASFSSTRPTFFNALISVAVNEGVNASLKNNSEWIYFNENLDIRST